MQERYSKWIFYMFCRGMKWAIMMKFYEPKSSAQAFSIIFLPFVAVFFFLLALNIVTVSLFVIDINTVLAIVMNSFCHLASCGKNSSNFDWFIISFSITLSIDPPRWDYVWCELFQPLFSQLYVPPKTIYRQIEVKLLRKMNWKRHTWSCFDILWMAVMRFLLAGSAIR